MLAIWLFHIFARNRRISPQFATVGVVSVSSSISLCRFLAALAHLWTVKRPDALYYNQALRSPIICRVFACVHMCSPVLKEPNQNNHGRLQLIEISDYFTALSCSLSGNQSWSADSDGFTYHTWKIRSQFRVLLKLYWNLIESSMSLYSADTDDDLLVLFVSYLLISPDLCQSTSSGWFDLFDY